MRLIRRRIQGRSVAVILLLASLIAPGCDSGDDQSGGKQADSRTAPAVKMSGHMNEWLSDGRFGLLVDRFNEDPTGPSTSPVTYYKVRFTLKNYTRTPVIMDRIVVAFTASDLKASVGERLGSEAAAEVRPFTNEISHVRDLDDPKGSRVPWTVAGLDSYEGESSGHFYFGREDRACGFTFYRGDTVLAGPFRVALSPSSAQGDGRVSKKAERPGPSVAAEQFRSDKIYIDSVPRGATVKLLPKGEDQGSGVELGTTPLVLDPSQAPSMRFLIMMEMDDYLKAVEPLKELKAWIDRFRLEQRIGGMVGGHQDYFEFDTPVSQVVSDAGGGLVALGPVYNLEWPRHHRLVALFIPKGVRPSVFYPLMPPPGTFELDERSYGASLRRDYQFSAEQEAEAVGSLSRCGKYVTKVRLSNRTDVARLYSLSAQKGYFISSISEMRVIPGYNDR